MAVAERCPCHPADVYGSLSRCPACGHWSLDDFCGACERRACGFAVDYRDFDRACQQGYGGTWLDWQLKGHAQDPADWPKKIPKVFPQELKVEGGSAENKGVSNRTDQEDTTMNSTLTRTDPTEKQMALLKKLFAEKAAVPGVPEVRQAMLDLYRKGDLSRKAASDTISWLMDQKAPRPAAEVTPDLEANRIYTNGTDYVRVVQGRNGNLYGKVRVDGSWEYRPGLLKGLRAITAEEAAAFGHQHDRCVFCYTALSDDGEGRSVEVGYGPICAAKYALPWGK